MTKWEYLIIQPSEHRNVDKPWTVNGRELRNWKKGPDIYDYINQLGDEGWELVNVASAAYIGMRYCFKRPKT